MEAKERTGDRDVAGGSDSSLSESKDRAPRQDAAATPPNGEKTTASPTHDVDGAPSTAAEPTKRQGASANDLASVPNGGMTAWLQCLGSFFLFFNTWGVINMFGVYQTIYQEGVLESSTASQISWIGSTQAFLLLLVGALTGPIYDAGYFRYLLISGSFMVVFGMMMVSICDKYWQFLLAQGFVVGLGTGLLFVPSVAILSTYFTTRLATATGIAASGSSLGGVLYPIILHKLLGQVGFGWTNRIIAFIILVTLAVPNTVMKMRVLPPAKRKVFDFSAFREPPYLLFVLGGITGFMGLYPPFFYVSLYSIQNGLASPNLSFYLLSILNAASVFGRLLPNVVADKTGPLNVIAPCALITGSLSLALIGAHSFAAVVAITALYGFFSGSFVSLPPTVIVSITKDRSVIGTRMGMCFMLASLGILIGAPVAGVIFDGGYNGVWAFAGASTISGALLMVGARVSKTGLKLMAKA